MHAAFVASAEVAEVYAVSAAMVLASAKRAASAVSAACLTLVKFDAVTVAVESDVACFALLASVACVS